MPERPRGQSCLLILCPLGLTLTTVPCPLQLQLLLPHLLLWKEEGGCEGVQRLREGPTTLYPWGTSLLPQPHDPPGPQLPSQTGQHSSSGCTWWVQLRGWHRMGSQITVRFWGQQVWGLLQGGTADRYWPPACPLPQPIPGSCRWSTSCHSRVPSGCHVPGAAPQRSKSWGPSSAAPGPWSWHPQRARPPPGPGGSLLHGTGWGCAPGGGQRAGRLAPLGDPASHADARPPSTVRGGGGSTHDHSTHHAGLLGRCHGMPSTYTLLTLL